MPRPRVSNEPLSDKERRLRSDAAKLERGEMRINNWISAAAAKALRRLTKDDDSRGAVKAAIEQALINEVERLKAK